MNQQQKVMQKKVMQMSSALVKRKIPRTVAMIKSWRGVKLGERLKQNKSMRFYFIKKDGSIRTANGTRHPEVMNKHIKGTGKAKVRHDIFVYFDLDKNCFRSFDLVNLIG